MIDIRESRELQATILAIKNAEPELRKQLYANARRELGSAWLPALQERVRTNLERRILLKGARVRVGQDGFRVMAATSQKKLSGGLIPASDWPGAEFGARNARVRYNRRSAAGTLHTVTRTVNRQFRGRQKHGQIAFDAASDLGTKLVASFVHTIVATYRDAVDDDRAV